jgi:hypothetical protein
MKIQYMIESALKGRNTEAPHYFPVGVWVMGDNDVNMFYHDGGELEEYANAIKARLPDQIPDDFLEYHRNQRSAYLSEFGKIETTEEYDSLHDAGMAILIKLYDS